MERRKGQRQCFDKDKGLLARGLIIRTTPVKYLFRHNAYIQIISFLIIFITIPIH
jgi:hypothetical protein